MKSIRKRVKENLIKNGDICSICGKRLVAGEQVIMGGDENGDFTLCNYHSIDMIKNAIEDGMEIPELWQNMLDNYNKKSSNE
ncbi:MAG: hypothetical protein FWE37_06800 [Spirochaetaceae bacterium]|nr:hypothetical protein [Spirochaetaceae bacterium]